MENRFLKKIKGYDGYGITLNGNVYSWKTEKYLSIQMSPNGYKTILLYNNGRATMQYIHRLVYEAFVGDIPKGLTIDHINEDKLDNKISNLQLLTRAENWRKFYDNDEERIIEGYKKINGFNNYYINKKGEVLSFKYGKNEEYKGEKIYTDEKGNVYLCNDNKRCARSINKLIRQHF